MKTSSRADPQPRMFLHVDPRSHTPTGLCGGPDAEGRCPLRVGDAVPCAGHRVIPLRGTIADGLPFSVSAGGTTVCPLAWSATPG